MTWPLFKGFSPEVYFAHARGRMVQSDLHRDGPAAASICPNCYDWLQIQLLAVADELCQLIKGGGGRTPIEFLVAGVCQWDTSISAHLIGMIVAG
jgi:hypothetical protein